MTSDLASFESVKEVSNELIRLMQEKFPECHYSIFINMWDDKTFRVECRYGESADINDEQRALHIYRWYNDEITYEKQMIPNLLGI